MLNCSTSKRPPNSTTVSKICSMMWESIRWPWASTRSCSGSGLEWAGGIWDLVSKLLGYLLLEGKLDFASYRSAIQARNKPSGATSFQYEIGSLETFAQCRDSSFSSSFRPNHFSHSGVFSRPHCL